MADAQYSIPAEAAKLLHDGIVNNPLHESAPAELKDAAQSISYEGTALPVIPINWRFAESITAIKGFEGAMLNVLLKRKYGLDEYPKIVIDTDHAQLFIMSAILSQVLDPVTNEPIQVLSDPGGEAAVAAAAAKLQQYFPDKDYHDSQSDWHRRAATNIYRTKDSRFYHIHGSMNPEPTQDALDIPHYVDPAPDTLEEASKPYQEKVANLNAAELDSLMNEQYRQAGTICWSTNEFRESEHGKANAHVGLYEVLHVANPGQAPTWWEPVAGTSPKRPLRGLKVVDLTRVIAGPSITRELAELGASVMRVAAPHICDMSLLFPDLGWGKWEAELDLRRAEDRESLKALIQQADVVVDGYRPGVMKKWGFGKEDILQMCHGRNKGIVYARENCYGWNGPWSSRSGWQQISDACCGVSLEFGRAMGNDEAVTPVFPNSDYCTGVAGATGILQALIERGEKGGSYTVDISLNYYSQWLVNSCGTYPKPIWEQVWANNGRQVFRHNDNMLVLLPAYMNMLKNNAAHTLFKPSYFEDRETKALGVRIRCVKPVLRFPGAEVELRFDVGTRGNGVDQPVWPQDLTTQVVQ